LDSVTTGGQVADEFAVYAAAEVTSLSLSGRAGRAAGRRAAESIAAA
jgi:hypothetical protein